MNESKHFPIEKDWKHIDRKLLMSFSILLVLAIAIVTVRSIVQEADITTTITNLIVVPVIVFPILGIIVFKFFKKGIIPNKIVLKWFVILSLPSGMVATIAILLLVDTTPNLLESVTFFEFLGLFFGLYFFMFCAALLFQLVLFFMGFGLVWLFSAIGKYVTPGVLMKIKDITSKEAISFQQKLLRWMFNIPDIVDTGTLTIFQGERKIIFLWSTLKKAIIWQMYLGILIVLYISLNPFLLESIDFDILINIPQYLLIIPSIIVIPWLIYLSLDARIKGPIKDFKLYNGLRQRIFQSVVAFSTIIVFIQYVINNPKFSFHEWIAYFSVMFLAFLVIVLVFSFIFFNYFETILVENISNDFTKKENFMNENIE